MDEAKKPLPKAAIAYLVVALIIMLGPLVAMLWYQEDPELQTSELATWPAAMAEDGTPNVEFLPQIGGYFTDHFAYRPEAITLHALLQTKTLGVSTTEQVIYGQDGWLFYSGTLNDFMGTNQPSQRAIFNETHNLKLLQNHVQASGAQFAVTIAPNKNSVFGEQMPYWYLPAPASDASQQPLIEALRAANVNYIDLFEDFYPENLAASQLSQYFQRDSHWTCAGAYRAYQTIMEQLNLLEKPKAVAQTNQASAYTALQFTDAEATPVQDHVGDIDALLYPTAARPEINYQYPLPAYEFTSQESTVEASRSSTKNPTGSGTLLMYRDSFANALIPFFSATFNQAYYSKLLPYDLTDLERYQPDVVLVQSAQRSTLNFSANPPAFASPIIATNQPASSEPANLIEEFLMLEIVNSKTTVNVAEDGAYTLVSGILDQEIAQPEQMTKALVYALQSQSDGTKLVREAFLTTTRYAPDLPQTTDFGYKIFLPSSAEELRGSTLDVIIKVDNSIYVLATVEF